MQRILTIEDSANVIERLRIFVIENMNVMSLDNARQAASDDKLTGFSVADDGLSITIYCPDDYKFLIQLLQKHANDNSPAEKFLAGM